MELEDSLRAGTLLRGGKYRIVKTLGQGGFGITYKAKMKLEAEGAIGKMTVESDVAIKEFFIKSDCERTDGSNAVTVPSKKKAGFIEDYRKSLSKRQIICRDSTMRISSRSSIPSRRTPQPIS